MAVYGDFQGTGGNLAVDSNLLKRDVEKLYNLEPDLAVLARFLRHPKLMKGTAKSWKHEWAETDNMAQFTQINSASGYTAGDTALVVDDSTIIAIKSIVVNQRTNETCRVTNNTTSTNTITVTRSFGGTAAAVMNDNDYITVLGSAPAEGDESAVGQVVNESWKDNYVQDFRHSYGVTDVQEASDIYFDSSLLARRRGERFRDHIMAIEMALFYGEKATVTSGDTRISSLGGIKEFISTYSYDFSGLPTFDELVTAAEDGFEYGADKKFLFCGKSGYSNVAKVTTDTIRSTSPVTAFGLKLRLLHLQHGDVILIKHRLFRGNQYTKRGFLLDLNNLKWKPLKGKDTYNRKDLQANSATAMKEEWRTVGTLQRIQEKTHQIWDNLA